jgi:hypothetical protein
MRCCTGLVLSHMTGQTIYADGGRRALNYTVPVEETALE